MISAKSRTTKEAADALLQSRPIHSNTAQKTDIMEQFLFFIAKYIPFFCFRRLCTLPAKIQLISAADHQAEGPGETTTTCIEAPHLL